MLIIPVHKKITSKNFPAVTFLLILINCLVFFILQSGDEDVFKRAVEYYFQSELPKIEVPRYQQYLKQSGNEQIESFLDKKDLDEEIRNYYQLISMEMDTDFIQALESGEIIRQDEEVYSEWRTARDEYEQIRDSSFTNLFLLKYKDTEPITLLTHMFMHGGFGHLFGNMLFLLLLGILVEGALGGKLYLVAYCIAGLFAATTSLLVHGGNPSGMLGASGAIAGLMGLYTILYGRRKIRFFYWFFIFFDYIKKPAIILLPFWLGWELLQFFSNSGNVAYEAHIGGIIGGVVLGLGFLQLGWENREFLDEETKRDAANDLFAAAMDDLDQFRVNAARSKLKQLLPEHGDDIELLKRYYNTCKLCPDHPDLHDAARRILLFTGGGAEHGILVKDTFRDYLKTGQGEVRLVAQERQELMVRLANWGHIREARVLADAMLKQKKTSAGTTGALLALGRACSAQGENRIAKYYLMQIGRRFPDSIEAVTAADLLRSIKAS